MTCPQSAVKWNSVKDNAQGVLLNPSWGCYKWCHITGLLISRDSLTVYELLLDSPSMNLRWLFDHNCQLVRVFVCQLVSSSVPKSISQSVSLSVCSSIHWSTACEAHKQRVCVIDPFRYRSGGAVGPRPLTRQLQPGQLHIPGHVARYWSHHLCLQRGTSS